MNLKSYLETLLKEISGNVIVIGVREQHLLEVLEANEKVDLCYTLNADTEEETKKKRWGISREKTISIKKFRKVFKKKRIDNIICNIDDMEKYLKIFIKDSVYIGRGKIYYFGKIRKIDQAKLNDLYKNYKITYHEEKLKDGKIVEIDLKDAKTYRIKEIFYRIRDGISSAANLIGDYLVH